MSDDGLAPGKRLSEIRQQLGLSQRRAAELSGLTHSAISTIEQDKVSPAISTLQKLLKVYGLSLSEFFSEPEKPDEPQVVINQDDLIEMGRERSGVAQAVATQRTTIGQQPGLRRVARGCGRQQGGDKVMVRVGLVNKTFAVGQEIGRAHV